MQYLALLLACAATPTHGRAGTCPNLVIDTTALEPTDEMSQGHVLILGYDMEGLHAAGFDAKALVPQAEKLLLTGRVEEAKPLLEVIKSDPDLSLQSTFMEGFVALHEKDFATAEERLRRALEIAPEFSRARAELGQALLGAGKRKEADEQFEIAERDKSLPQDVQDLVRASRRITAERARWYLNVDVAAVADSNINNGIEDELVHLTVGGVRRTVRAAPERIRQSGFGPYFSARAGVNVRVGQKTALSLEAEASATEYGTGIADEASLLLALGPELSLPSGAVSLQAIGYQRSYGGETSAEGLGLRLRYQARLNDAGRIFLYADGRTTSSGQSDSLEGYTASGLIAYEHTLSSKLSTSGTLVVRREWLASSLASNIEYAAYYNLGALLPLGLRGGGSLGAAYLVFDATNTRLSDHPRSDWRVNAGAYLTTQKALLGLWPTLGYTYITTASSISLFDAERHRVRFNVAKRF
jgi:tetratricopeptide (TPR) repeat protein